MELGTFTVITHKGKFVNEDKLHLGIISRKRPSALYDENETIESLINHRRSVEKLNIYLGMQHLFSDVHLKNLGKCELTKVKLICEYK